MRKEIIEYASAYDELVSAEKDLEASVAKRAKARVRYRLAKDALTDLEIEAKRV